MDQPDPAEIGLEETPDVLLIARQPVSLCQEPRGDVRREICRPEAAGWLSVQPAVPTTADITLITFFFGTRKLLHNYLSASLLLY